MKKKILFIAVLFSAISAANARHVDPNAAMYVAKNYLQQNGLFSGLSIAYVGSEKSLSGEDDYYIYDVNNSKGFILVSAEGAGHPVIGYSTESAYVKPSPSSNPNYYYWLEKRKAEIEYMRSENIQATSEIENEWNTYAAATFKQSSIPKILSVGPLCSTTWNQSGGGAVAYNNLCPGGSVTGCVATAMAQIMKKWAYPTTGTGSSSYCDCTASGFTSNYGTLSANYGATTYNWGSMPNGSSNSYVATLMYHCGVSVNMDYSPPGSGSFVTGGNPSAQYSYVHYFGYDPGIHNVTRAGDASWVQDLKTEFDNGRPVQYYGYTPGFTEGHSWVADGYDASNNIHMNWGWGGYDNGYYAVNNLAPPGTGYDFGTGDGALLGIKPAGTPGPTLMNGYCGITEANITDPVWCNPVKGATAYKVRASDQGSSFVGYLTRSYPNFLMSMIPGVVNNKTYNIDISVCVGGIWGSYGSICTVTTPVNMPTTQLNGSSCGVTLVTLSDVLNCVAVNGASNYGYRVSNAASSYTVTYTSPSFNTAMQMNSIPGIQFGKTYNVEVRVMIGGLWGNYGPICTVATPGSIPTSQLAGSSCGATLASLDGVLTCVYVSGATNYGYRISNAASSYTVTYTSPSYNTAVQMNSFPGIQLGKTYNVEVRALVNGVWGNYGAICTVTTPGSVPGSQLSGSSCGVTLTSIDNVLTCIAVSGASNYGYRVSNSASSYTVTYTSPSYNTAIQMNSIPGVQYGKTYNVEVRALVNGVWGNYGPVCTVTTPASVANPQASASVSNMQGGGAELQVQVIHQMTVFPNPAIIGEDLNLMIDGASSSGETRIDIYSITGERIYSSQMNYSTGSTITIPLNSDLAGGVYLINAYFNDSVIHQKFIIEQ